MTEMTMTPEHAHVLVAFDDFSLAGRHLLRHVDVRECERNAIALPATTPAVLTQHLEAFSYGKSEDEASPPLLTLLLVQTAGVAESTLWELTASLVDLLSELRPRKVTILASLHLPQAKPHSVQLQNVYHGVLNATSSERMSDFPSFDLDWEIKDTFLSRFVHFLHIEGDVETHLLLLKGYKPGRDGAGTKEALETLAKALARYTDDLIAVDVQTAVKDAIHSATPASEQHNLLYQ